MKHFLVGSGQKLGGIKRFICVRGGTMQTFIGNRTNVEKSFDSSPLVNSFEKRPLKTQNIKKLLFDNLSWTNLY